MTTTRFKSQACHSEKGFFHAYFRSQTGGGTCHQKEQLKKASFMPISDFAPPPKGVAEKGYLLHKKEKRCCRSHFFLLSRNRWQNAAHVRRLAIMDPITLTLPYPPTVNHYWKTRVVRRGDKYVPSVYVSDIGQDYQRTVKRLLDGVPKFAGQVRVQILVQPPDGRRRDLDNVLKCLLDSLTTAGVWNDDSQVDSLLVVRGVMVDGGSVLVIVEELI